MNCPINLDDCYECVHYDHSDRTCIYQDKIPQTLRFLGKKHTFEILEIISIKTSFTEILDSMLTNHNIVLNHTSLSSKLKTMINHGWIEKITEEENFGSYKITPKGSQIFGKLCELGDEL